MSDMPLSLSASASRERRLSTMRSLIARGIRPTFRVKWQWDGTGAVLEFLDIPGLWAIASGHRYVRSSARRRLAGELGVNERAFDVELIATRPIGHRQGAGFGTRGGSVPIFS